MHRASLPLAIAGLFAEQLGHGEVGSAALGDEVAVSAVGAGDVIILPQRGAGPGRDGLLANVEMHKTGYVPGRKLPGNPLLESADENHGAVHFG
jgi:hypothetical protein